MKINSNLKKDAFALSEKRLNSQQLHQNDTSDKKPNVNISSNDFETIKEENMGYNCVKNNYRSFPMIPQVNIFMNSANEKCNGTGHQLQQVLKWETPGKNNISNSHINLNLNAKEFFPHYTSKVSKGNIQNHTEWYQNYTEYTDEELAQIASFLIRDQCGCRFFQNKISTNPSFANETLYYYLQNDMLELICDFYGNYFVQKLIDFLDIDKIEWMVDLISPVFMKISKSPHGTRVVQKIIEKIEANPNLFLKFTQIFSESLVELTKDANGKYIIQKYVSAIGYPTNQLAFTIIIQHFLEIMMNKHGCFVLQKCIEVGNEAQKSMMVVMIINQTLDLIVDQYGNYLLHFLLEMNNPEICRKIARICLPFLAKLAKHKYASTVIEKCIYHSTPEVQELIINEIVTSGKNIRNLLLDSFGNYVLQMALSVSHDRNYYKILKIIAGNINKIKQKQFGNKLIAHLFNNYKELELMLTI